MNNKIQVFICYVLCYAQINYCKGQKREFDKDINSFLDGYAWQAIQTEMYPNRDLNYDLYLGGFIYSFFTKNGEGKELKNRPYTDWRIFFVKEPLWTEERKRKSIKKDELLANYPIIFNQYNIYCEIDYVDFNGKILDTLKHYNGGSNQFILYKNTSDTMGIVFGKYVSPTLIIDYRRVIEPPKFVQDFIISLKKEFLRPIVRNKSYLHNENFERTSIYLIKDDKVEVLKEKDNWLRIRYYGKKTIEGWIRKEDVE